METEKTRDSGRWPWHRKVLHALADRGMSRAAFARAIGIDESTVRRWIRDQNAPADVEVLGRIARFFGWSLDFMLQPDRTFDEPYAIGDLRSAADTLPPDIRRIVLALSDRDTLGYLLEQLTVYERLRDQAALSGSPAPRGTARRDSSKDRRDHT